LVPPGERGKKKKRFFEGGSGVEEEKGDVARRGRKGKPALYRETGLRREEEESFGQGERGGRGLVIAGQGREKREEKEGKLSSESRSFRKSRGGKGWFGLNLRKGDRQPL